MSCCCEKMQMILMCVRVCLVLSVCPFFYLLLLPNPSLSLPRLFLTGFEGCCYCPTLPLPRHTISSKEKVCCCKRRRKKFFCLFACFFFKKPRKRNTELGRAWSCPVECPKSHLACVRKDEIKSAPEKWNQTYMTMLSYWTKTFFVPDSHKVRK